MTDRFADAYEELRRLAHAQLRRHERTGLLDTTALVHESWLRVAQSRALSLEDRRHFMGYAAKVMRSVIVDHARARLAERRGGALQQVTLDSHVLEQSVSEDDLIRIDEALLVLETVDARLARIVELRFFAGLTADETAETLDMAPRTLYREWDKARLILADAIRAG